MPDPDDAPGTDSPDAADDPDPEPDPTPSGAHDRDGSPPDGTETATDTEAETASDDEAYGPTEGPAGREVVVPARLYKTVTVMSTLVAMVSVVGGFIALDAATNRASAAAAEINTPLALLGLGLIVGGAGAYAFATRFRAADLGDDEDADDETDGGPDTSAGD